MWAALLGFELFSMQGAALEELQIRLLRKKLTAHKKMKGNEAIRITASDVEQKDFTVSVLGNVHDINGDQEGQVPLLEMPCSFTEFHYTEQRQSQSHCAAAAQH